MDRKAENAVDSDEEDEDFVPEKDDAGSPTGDTDEEGSDGGEEGKEPAAPKPAAATKNKREWGEKDDGKKKKKQKKQKDPNAPKRALSTFMYFSQAEREELKKKSPGLPFKEVGRLIGDRWKKLSKEEKEPYENSARLDQARYKKEMAEYRSGGQTPGGGPSGDESD